jgi:arylsulfatase A
VSGPNIVLILADDMGYGDLGCFNDAASQTPTLDDLVRDGLCFTQHYSASPVCAPARASLLTGRYPQRTGAIDTLEHRGLDRIALGERTIADVLRSAGYVTGLVGKWHNGALDHRFHPNQRGFDEFAGFSGGWSDYWDWRLDRNGIVTAGDGRYLTDVLTDEAIGFIRRHRHDPFFLLLAYSAPHYPFQAHDDDVTVFRDTGRFTSGVSSVYGMIRCMDRDIAAVLDELDDDTLLLFSSDNGPQFSGEGDYSTTRFNCGYRGAKGSVHEGGVRLPLIVRWPNGLADSAGQVDDLVHFTDWLPTLAAVAGATVPDVALDGVDVLPLLQGASVEVPDVRFWQWNRYTPVAHSNAAMRDGRWKLVRPAIASTMTVAPADLAIDIDLKNRPEAYEEIGRAPEPERVVGPAASPLLFDIDIDPGEEHDLAAAEPARVDRMAAELDRWFEAVEAERLTISG